MEIAFCFFLDRLLTEGQTFKYRESAAIDIFSQRNIITLRVVENIPELFAKEVRFIKQRSLEWFEARKHNAFNLFYKS